MHELFEKAGGEGPLAEVKVIEIAGIGPLPFAAMLLADQGARVVRVEPPGKRELGIGMDPERSVTHRGRDGVALDLKSADGRNAFKALLRDADVLLEGMRPGAAERLDLGPGDCAEINPGLVYGRLSGWGREGANAATAGHDINYAAEAGLLSLMGPAGQPPVPPVTFGADFPAGMLLAYGVMAALTQRASTGEGSVVDQSILGAAELNASIFRALQAMGRWPGGRGENVLDGGAPYYRCYETADGGHLAVGAIESRFYEVLVERLDLAGKLPDRAERANWPEIEAIFAETFKRRSRTEWEEIFADSDACVAPVLDLSEAAVYAKARGDTESFERNGLFQKGPQPKIRGIDT